MKTRRKLSMSRPFWMAVVCLLLVASSCQKDKELDAPSSLSAFAIESETKAAVIDEQRKTITVHIGDLMDWQNLKVTFSAENAGQLMHHGQALASGSSTLDLTKPVELTLRSSGGTHQDTWQVEVNSLVSDYGLGRILQKAGSVDKGYPFYFDQGESGTFRLINCGPAVTAMSIKWGDDTFAGTPQQARAAIRSSGGWWFTSDIANYLHAHGVSVAYAGLATTISVTEYGNKMMDIIDKGYAAILCLDMFYVQHEANPNKRINKFYSTAAKDWGHFVLVKGYKVVDETVWLEIHDPFSIGETYSINNQLKGKNRYYAVSELKKATDIWWPHTMVVAPKGTNVVGVSVLPPHSVNTLMHQRGR